MKLLLLFLFFTNNSFASFVAESEIDDPKTIYARKALCQKKEKESCYKWKKTLIAGAVKLEVRKVDKDIYSKNEAESCDSRKDCRTKVKAKECADEDEKAIFIEKEDSTFEAYCTKYLRTDKIDDPSGQKELVKDESKHADKVAAREAKQAARAAKQAEVKDTLEAKLKDGKDLTPNQLRKVLLYLLRAD
jgi:hypothetical protein